MSKRKFSESATTHLYGFEYICVFLYLVCKKKAHTLVTKANLSGYKFKLGQSRCLYHCVYVWVKKQGTQYNVMCVGKSEGSKSQARDQSQEWKRMLTSPFLFKLLKSRLIFKKGWKKYKEMERLLEKKKKIVWNGCLSGLLHLDRFFPHIHIISGSAA